MFKGKCLPRVRICAPVYGGKAALQQLRRRQSDGVSSALERRGGALGLYGPASVLIMANTLSPRPVGAPPLQPSSRR